MAPLFSILHPSARPQKWREIYEDWMTSAAHPENVEYVLCVDERWGFAEFPGFADTVSSIPADMPWGKTYWTTPGRIVWNTLRQCYVDSVNIAAKASTGRILIVIADDQYPCEYWDERIAASLMIKSDAKVLDREFVLTVSTGTPYEHERGIIVMPILSRVRYERLGYVFFPEYESVYADNDFYSEAVRDKCIIDARHHMFPHRHPLGEPGAWDKRGDGKWIHTDQAYAAQNRREAYVLGEKIFSRRFGFSFGRGRSQTVKQTTDGTKHRGIALALPGESFSNVWVAKLLEITTALLRDGWNYCTMLQHTSEPGITRQTIVNSVRELKGQFDPEFILWLDDDQIVEPDQVAMLINDADQFPDVDLFAGWTWIASSGPHSNEPQVSCGRMNLDKGELSYAEYRSVQSANGVFEVGWSGFPLVLMRVSALEKVGKHPFTHYPCPESPWGECGEDISFCKRLTDAGGRIYVDSRVFVPHLKLKALGPVPASREEIALALTGRAPDVEDPSLEEKIADVQSHARAWLELHKQPKTSAAD